MGDTRHVAEPEHGPAKRTLRPAAPGGAAGTDSTAKQPPTPASDTGTAAKQPPAPASDTGTAPKQPPAPASDSGTAAEGSRRRFPALHNPRSLGPALRTWSRQPHGRVVVPGLFLFLLVALTGASGALLVPQTLAGTVTAAPTATEAPFPAAPAPGLALPPTPGPEVTATAAPLPTGRPADVLADWARQLSPKVGIDPVALQAYGYAELVLNHTTPGCALTWPTLAAIGWVESRHGQANGARLQPDGVVTPEIIGPQLNGQGGTQRIPDTDEGRLDQDSSYDRAVGPMQFIPTTWELMAIDADNDGWRNPHDLDDAALAAGNYLCQGGRNLTVAADWWNAILSYNDVGQYAQDVFDKSNEYGTASRT